VKTTLWRASLRHMLLHPWQLALAALGIALGVAVVVAVDLANDSARRAFDLSAQAVTGRASHQITGGPNGVPDSIYVKLRRQLGVDKSAPFLSGHLTMGTEVLQLIGIDPFAEGEFRNLLDFTASDDRTGLMRDLLTRPGSILMSRELAESHRLSAGDTIELLIGGERHPALLLGSYMPPASRSAIFRNILITDLASAQELLRREGELSRIDLILEGPDATGIIQSILPAGVHLLPAGSRSLAIRNMTHAFSLNLTAMSLLALVVGMFLIYNSISFSVLQRRELLGNLRVLGATRRDIFSLVLGEGLLIGIAGTGIGLLLGTLLAQQLIHLVTRTINDLYFVLTVSDLLLQPASLLKGGMLGITATLVAVAIPASEAALSPPRSVQERSRIEGRTRRLRLPLTWLGLGCMACALALLFIDDSLVSGFVALFVLILGFSLLTPTLVTWFSQAATRLLGRGIGVAGRMAVRGVYTSLSRTGVAIAALSIAISTTVGVGVMVDSFRGSVQQWLQSTLRGDIYISPDLPSGTGNHARLQPEIIQAIGQLPGIAEISRGRHTELHSDRGITQLFAIHMAQQSYAGVELLQGDPETAWPKFDRGQAVLISEPYAYRHGLKTGDTLQLETDHGRRSFAIAGIYRDYGSEHGVVSMRMALYREHWNDDSVYSIGLYLEPGTDPNQLINQIHALVGGRQDLLIRSNRTLHQTSMDTFDRTFVITNVLRLLAICVAFVGILSALLSLQLEKARELAILRATGFTPRQVWGVTLGQTGFMGLVSGVLAIPLGLILALVLVFVINRRAFGWSMDLVIPGSVLIEALALALVSALLAGLYPAWRMSRTSPAQALREE
jgi:putative ABC transport system permease protein